MSFVWSCISPLLKRIFHLFPALEAVFHSMFPRMAIKRNQVQNIQYTVNLEDDGSKTISDQWRPLSRQKKQLSEEKREVLSTRFTIEFDEDGRMEIHHGWEPFPLEERKAEDERYLNSYLNEQSFPMQLARFNALSPMINMLDDLSRARLSQTCKAMQLTCQRREVTRLDLPITFVIYRQRGQWLARGEHRNEKRTLDLTPHRENLVKTCDIRVTRLEVEWWPETVAPFERVKDLLREWNVQSMPSLLVEMTGGNDVYWRTEEFRLMGFLAMEFQLKRLELPNVWVRDAMLHERNIAHVFRGIAEDMNRLVVVMLGL